MNKKVALLIIYNHRFDRNIQKIEELYKGKFSYIYHIMPFYDGTKENVIPVFYSSYVFEGFIAQAYQHLKNEKFTHFFFVADDMVINPSITEDNIFDILGLSTDESWINGFSDYKSRPYHYRVPLYVTSKIKGIEVKNLLPSPVDVKKIFDEKGLSYFPNKWYALRMLLKYLIPPKDCPKRNVPSALLHCISYISRFDFKNLYKLKDYYPGIWGCADIMIVPSVYMDKFAQYCGIFAGLNLFVENAIPLALLISSSKICTEKDIRLKTIPQLYAMGKNYEKEFIMKYNYSMEKLLSDYPHDTFFIHPLKLSKWK